MREYYDPENPEFDYHYKEEEGRGQYKRRVRPKGFLRRNIMLLVLFMNVALVSLVTTVIGPKLQDRSNSVNLDGWEFTLKGYPWEGQLLISLEAVADKVPPGQSFALNMDFWGDNPQKIATLEGNLFSNKEERQFFRTAMPVSGFGEKLNCRLQINGQERIFSVIIDTQEDS